MLLLQMRLLLGVAKEVVEVVVADDAIVGEVVVDDGPTKCCFY